MLNSRDKIKNSVEQPWQWPSITMLIDIVEEHSVYLAAALIALMVNSTGLTE